MFYIKCGTSRIPISSNSKIVTYCRFRFVAERPSRCLSPIDTGRPSGQCTIWSWLSLVVLISDAKQRLLEARRFNKHRRHLGWTAPGASSQNTKTTAGSQVAMDSTHLRLLDLPSNSTFAFGFEAVCNKTWLGKGSECPECHLSDRG